MAQQTLIGIWCEQLANVVEFMTGHTTKATVASGEAELEEIQETRCIAQTFSKGSAWVVFPQNSWEQGGVLLTSTPAGEDDAQVESTWLEVIAQTAATVADAISRDIGDTIEPHTPSLVGDVGNVKDSFSVSLLIEGTTIAVTIAFDAAFSGLLAGSNAAKPGKSKPEAKPLALTTSEASVAPPAAEMDLLLDVELPVSVSFGHTYLPLRDVLRLTTGSLIELDRLISEPVDIVVNNCVIAKGEVVVVEGSYGVRILDVVSRGDRLAVRKVGMPLPAYQEYRLKAGV